MGRCIRTGLCMAMLAATGLATAADGATVGIGLDASQGDYGGAIDTTIVSVPLEFRVRTGRWSLDATLPWLRVTGDRNVVPTLGPLPLHDPIGGDAPERERTTTTGIGDLRLSAKYAVDTGSALGLALGAGAKLATADEAKGLGTGSHDYNVTVDLHRAIGGTLLFAGAEHAWLGDSARVSADTRQRARVGVSHGTGRGRLGVMLEQRSALVEQRDGRRDVTAFYTLPTDSGGRFKVYATRGLSESSPDWGAGVAVSAGF